MHAKKHLKVDNSKSNDLTSQTIRPMIPKVKKRKILDTGAVVFISSALSIRLLDLGDNVVGLDDHNDYIESTFGTIRQRAKRSKGCLNGEGMLHMMFKLSHCAQKNWRKLRGLYDLEKVIEGVCLTDGIEVSQQTKKAG